MNRTAAILEPARLTLAPDARLEIVGADPVLGSRFRIGEAVAVALGLVGCEAAHLHALRGGSLQSVRVDVQAAAATLLGFLIQKCEGIDLARVHNAVTGFYPAGDGRWIHLHGGFPHLAAGTLEVLGCAMQADAITAALRRRSAQEWEDALAAEALCGAMVRSPAEWDAHAQGEAVAPLAAVEIERIGEAETELLPPSSERPLEGLRVLDLTRVLAGPSCGRALAEHGADVLRIGAERLPSVEPFVIDTGRGKRNAYLDLDRAADADRLRELIAEADVVCEGYRRGSLERRGFGPEALAALRPGIVVVSIHCYGAVGPWADRPGWEQLAQSATGLAHTEGGDGPPALIPAAATDYTTGALAAFGALRALSRRASEGGSWHVRASLCQTGMWLRRLGATCDPARATGLGDLASRVQRTKTAWGDLVHLAPVVEMEKTPAFAALPPAPLGSHEPVWLPR